jgi:hypothetical protein
MDLGQPKSTVEPEAIGAVERVAREGPGGDGR